MAVIEVPLLLETGGEKRVDAVIVVSAPPEAQRERVMQRPGMTLEKLEQMLTRQMSDADKRARADFVVDTGGTFADTDAQVDKVVESLEGPAGHGLRQVLGVIRLPSPRLRGEGRGEGQPQDAGARTCPSP